MGPAIVVIFLILGVILYTQARRQDDAKRARRLRYLALASMLVALALAIFDALDIVQDHGASDIPPGGVDIEDPVNA